ncbi:serine/threonine-protein kinase [Actinoplanes sp. NPDC051475]|uniref:serine/threonine-protein kinase n=1 Tax=Actinoplanes sp. NPDC051475 TaxID=3157225 RepID=UPI00344D336F
MDTAYRAGPLHQDDPEHLGGYTLVGRLGSGGMGVVYLGRDHDNSYVALKIVHAGLAHHHEFQERFRSEVARARQVPPFCTAEVLGADLDHDPPYLVIEYVDGPSLTEVIQQRGPLRAANLHSLAVGVATALTGIHGAGVIHRDLKPDNVLLPPGNPKVIDFGIARMTEATSQLTAADQTIGTIAYMAPERLDTSARIPLTAAADVFSWGCVVAYAATGHAPFDGDSAPATAARILTQPPEISGLPEPMRRIVEAALAKEPQLRPTARELLDMLLDGADPTPATAPPPARSEPEPGGRRRLRRRVAGAVTAAVLIGGTAVGFAALTKGTDEHRAASSQPGGGAYIKDALRAPSQFTNVETASHLAKCEVSDVLKVVRVDRASYMCSGPEVIVKDGFSAKVTAYLGTRGTCAAMRFLWNPGLGGNVLHVCHESISVTAVTGATTKTVGTLPAAQPIALNQPVQIRIAVSGGVVQVFRGGGRVGEMRLPAGNPTEGKIRLGIEVGDEGGRSPFSVAFSHLEVTAL